MQRPSSPSLRLDPRSRSATRQPGHPVTRRQIDQHHRAQVGAVADRDALARRQTVTADRAAALAHHPHRGGAGARAPARSVDVARREAPGGSRARAVQSRPCASGSPRCGWRCKYAWWHWRSAAARPRLPARPASLFSPTGLSARRSSSRRCRRIDRQPGQSGARASTRIDEYQAASLVMSSSVSGLAIQVITSCLRAPLR